MPIARHCLNLAAVAVLSCGLGGGAPGDSAYAESSIRSANRIAAVYRVDLAGDFRLTTVFRGTDYEMQGEGRFSVLEGLLFEWRGTTASRGKFAGSIPEPAMYALNFVGGDKSQRLRMTFDGGAVTEISRVPKKRPNPHVIPTTKEQLEGVLDPMTAAFLYARSENPNGDLKVCDQTVPVFDGEQRFNLILKPKRTAKLDKNASTSYSGFAAVCGVKFIPISGHRLDNPGIKPLLETNEFEVWLVSLPGTEMYVFYRIVLPTLVGYGSATSTSFEIQRGAKRASIDQLP
jgi:Protein of unknown function (DUF3108)